MEDWLQAANIQCMCTARLSMAWRMTIIIIIIINFIDTKYRLSQQ